MRAATILLAISAIAIPAVAGGDGRDRKAEVLSRIEALLGEGDLDGAKEMIDFFLGKNPGDADLLRLLDSWRVRKGDLSGLFAEGIEKPGRRSDLRAAALRAVRATLRGNPEEWEALPLALPEAEWKALLAPLAGSGSPEDRRTAEEMIARSPPAPSPERPSEELIEAAKRGRDECLLALREAESRKLAELRPLAQKVFASAGEDAELRAAAGGVLLALGDGPARAALRKSLDSARPIEAVESMQVLVRHPGGGERPIQALLQSIEADDEVLGRLKPTLAALGIAALGRVPAETGARAYLEGKLASADHHVDAARALGALGDGAAVPALLAYLRTPLPRDEEGAAEGGLGFLGGAEGLKEAAAADEVRPYLVASIALLRLTR
ncbi:MAG: hypothetical protein MUE73_05925 [Planctomycetes bacterium]|jgi:hypothetical protein|nr:hypothetical protein [Planctomycetota bacterium]